MTYAEFSEMYTQLHVTFRGVEPFNLQVRRAYRRLSAVPQVNIYLAVTKELSK
jgi:hypothetical protein